MPRYLVIRIDVDDEKSNKLPFLFVVNVHNDDRVSEERNDNDDEPSSFGWMDHWCYQGIRRK